MWFRNYFRSRTIYTRLRMSCVCVCVYTFLRIYNNIVCIIMCTKPPLTQIRRARVAKFKVSSPLIRFVTMFYVAYVISPSHALAQKTRPKVCAYVNGDLGDQKDRTKFGRGLWHPREDDDVCGVIRERCTLLSGGRVVGRSGRVGR